eukprot:5955777-Pyramimonas_sp.AAC.1
MTVRSHVTSATPLSTMHDISHHHLSYPTDVSYNYTLGRSRVHSVDKDLKTDSASMVKVTLMLRPPISSTSFK